MIRILPARSSPPTSAPRRFSRRALVVLLALGVPALAMVAVGATPSRRSSAGRTYNRGKYVAIPHPADADTRRKGAYLARSRKLPLIAETGVTEVVIKEYAR